ncbi:unnamed protein product [Didymodactylos carnosus]|uniref:Laminin subunit beta-1 n=2 Tax=Didymodactylos carnosus TaxID=1234261 RepID=A0A814QUQ5_9BILA|nr:unnamed protein product [Didymodactylos carnosus]CAF3888219.1 unnamed protein product [Didymodactylos carnosus]
MVNKTKIIIVLITTIHALLIKVYAQPASDSNRTSLTSTAHSITLTNTESTLITTKLSSRNFAYTTLLSGRRHSRPLNGSIRRRRPTTRRPLSMLQPDCDYGGCYPETGDLLIGREKNLYSNSTCGLKQPERYCIIGNTKNVSCNVCDIKVTNKSHTIENIVTKYGQDPRLTWWQAENDVEQVYIQLNLEAEFVFTHLIMKFRTFRPKGMIIEKSSDYGKTWRTYAYFSSTCRTMFPYISTELPNNIDQVYCESRYSDETPSTGGEVIFRVLSPSMLGKRDPYSHGVQELIKITNLRINFTKLHTLGDNFLDTRQETTPKYYYAIHEMVVRGSCSCYGHAKRCVQTDEELPSNITIPGKVHGKCECTHNTKGMNCERCLDLYNDRPWRPARTGQSNPCRLCECHGHAKQCRFDPTRYAQTNYTSGGICEECEHNTIGAKCEYCKDLFYKDSQLPITDPHVCKPCHCDVYGTRNKGSCVQHDDQHHNLHAGQCICKDNVEGTRCDKCKAGYYNLDYNNPQGCQACDCHSLGIVDKQCDTISGLCQCKQNVIGRRCDQCQENYYGLNNDEVDGCKPCDCYPGGSYSSQCDIQTGQCPCREGMNGRQCDTPITGTYCAGLQYFTYEAELAKIDEKKAVIFSYDNPNEYRTWTGTSIVRIYEGGTIEFDVYHTVRTGYYDLIIRYLPATETWEDARILVISQNRTQSTNDFCGTNYEQTATTKLPAKKLFEKLEKPLCLNENEHYKIQLQLRQYGHGKSERDPVVSIDSIVLIPHIEKLEEFVKQPLLLSDFEAQQCKELALTITNTVELPEVCRKVICGISALMLGRTLPCDCDTTGSVGSLCDPIGGQCQCKPHVIGLKCNMCMPGSYRFSSEGCTKCNCHNTGALNNLCDVTTGACHCRPNAHGRDCGDCSPGYWNFPNCQRCECHGHSELCDKNGVCIDCRDSTAGDHCERCADGYYGDARLGLAQICRPCYCPGGPGSSQQFGDSCVHDPYTQQVVCRCRAGYTGQKCTRCAIAYYGNPTDQGGRCQPCECNNNVNVDDPDSCDRRTGACLKCLYNTGGRYCEQCRQGYYGDPLGVDKCQPCDCGIGGLDNNCNSKTGDCVCKDNVIDSNLGDGIVRRCSQCRDGYWGLGRGHCSSCNCDIDGSTGMICDKFTGQCLCKYNRGGLRCDQCPPGTYGDPLNPNIDCNPCQCSNDGSINSQCDAVTGQCLCKTGVTGKYCDRCARGLYGLVPYCTNCGQCFSKWDNIIGNLTDKVNVYVDRLHSVEIRQIESITNGNLFQQTETLLDSIQNTLGLKYTEYELEPYKQKYFQLNERLIKLSKSLNNEFIPNFQDQSKRFRFEEDVTRMSNVIKETYSLISVYKIQYDRLKHADLQSAGVSAKNIELQMKHIKEELNQLLIKIEQNLHYLQRLNQTLNNEKIYFQNQKLQEQVTNLTQVYHNINDQYVNKGNVSEVLCGNHGNNDVCDVCGGEGCDDLSRCTNSSSIKCSSSVHGILNNLLIEINDTQQIIEKKQNETNLIYTRYYEAEKDVSLTLTKTINEWKRLIMINDSLNITQLQLNKSHIQIQILEDLLKNTKPSDIQEIIKNILNMKITITQSTLETLTSDILKLVESTRISQQTDNENEKIRDATYKLDRAKNLENDLVTYVRSFATQIVDIKTLDSLIDNLNNQSIHINEMVKETNQKVTELKSSIIQVE